MKLKCGCPKENERYSEKYDAFYCVSCFIWLEAKCKDKTCGYCKDRPKFPPLTISDKEMKKLKGD